MKIYKIPNFGLCNWSLLYRIFCISFYKSLFRILQNYLFISLFTNINITISRYTQNILVFKSACRLKHTYSYFETMYKKQIFCKKKVKIKFKKRKYKTHRNNFF
jgi:hypothetical protein